MTPIATLMMPGRGDTDLLLARFAERMMARGLRLRGTVQINSDCGPDSRCDMDIRVLPDGPVIRISQSLGSGSRGCRLDTGALERAVAAVQASLDDGADLLVINKFGKHEAEGRGFREVLAEAVGLGLPVVVGLNGLNEAAFESFAGELAIRCAPTLEALEAWVEAAVAGSEADAS